MPVSGSPSIEEAAADRDPQGSEVKTKAVACAPNFRVFFRGVLRYLFLHQIFSLPSVDSRSSRASAGF
jgi:hypothetical protein